jgi:hypothetical protein
MVRINLLPSYVFDAARNWTVSIIFVILLAIVGVLTLLSLRSAGEIAAWYTADAAQFAPGQGWKKEADDQVAAAAAWTEKAGKYTKYLTFFSNSPSNEAVKYANDVAAVFENASTKVGGQGGAWYNEMTISGTSVTLKGKINGLINFTHYYVLMKKKNFKVEPAQADLKENEKATMAQSIDLTLTGTIDKQFPPAPADFDEAKDSPTLFQQGTAAPAAGGTTPPPGGATTPPAGGTTTPPAGGTTTPPAGGATTPPAGGATTPPAGGTTPPAGGATTPPASGASLAPVDRGYI